MPNITAPVPMQPIIDKDGKQTQVMRDWTRKITDLDLIVGTGSPENVVSANQSRFYLDSTGTAGSILYVKRDAAIAGDTKKGWILV